MRIAGVLLLLITGIGGGFLVAGNEVKAVQQTEEILRLLQYLIERIRDYREPLPEIFAGFSSELLTACGFLPHYPEHPERALRGCLLSEELAGALMGLSLQLGKQFSAATLRELEQVAALAGKQAESLQAALPSKRKTALTLGISAGVLAVILLY